MPSNLTPRHTGTTMNLWGTMWAGSRALQNSAAAVKAAGGRAAGSPDPNANSCGTMSRDGGRSDHEQSWKCADAAKGAARITKESQMEYQVSEPLICWTT
jgi:hypothetical protein